MERTGFIPDELPAPRLWTTREERTLIEHYGRSDLNTCCRLLPRRTKRAIRQHAYAIRKRSSAA